MKITLYKNCILSRSYSEVFDCKVQDENGKTARDRYLETLESRIYELDMVYSTNSGSINIPLEIPQSTDNLYDYNYMKIEYESITRYCFIDDIQFMNMIGVVYYSEDIWHSYITNLSLRNSFLSNTKLLKFTDRTITRHFLPMEYETKSPLQIIRRISDTNKYSIVAQVQLTKPAQQGERTERQCFTVSLGKYDSDTAYTKNNFDKVQHTLYYDEAIELCNLAVRLSAQQMRDEDETKRFTGSWFYEITNFTIIPDNFGFYKPSGETQPVNEQALFTAQIQALDVDNDKSQQLLFAYEVKTTDTVPLPILNTYPISNDYTLIGVGTLSTNYDVINDGNDFDLIFRYYASEIDFKFILEMQGKFIDITDGFTYEVPFTSLTGSELAQQRTAKALQITNGATNIVGGVTKIGLAVASGGTTEALLSGAQIDLASDMAFTQTALNRARSTKSKSLYMSQLRSMRREERSLDLQQYNNAYGIVGNTVSGIGSVISGTTNIIQATQPNYVSNNGTFSSGNNALSILYGFVLKYIIPSNEKQVNDIIDNLGYSVNEMVNNEIFTPSTPNVKYNAIKFTTVNVFGKAPQSVIEKIKSILLNGTKIYYNENI